jgi:O-antigen ligase
MTPIANVRSADQLQAQVYLALVASATSAIVGTIPFDASDGFMQPVIRAIFMLFAFAALGVAAMIMRISITASWRFFSLPLLVFVGWCGLTTLWSVNYAATFARTTETALTFVFLQSYVFVAAQSCRSPEICALLLARSLIAAVVFGMLINLVLFGTPIHYWMNPDVPERPRFTFGYLHPLAAGDILAIGILTTMFSPWRILTKLIAIIGLFSLLLLTDSTGARLAVIALVPLIVFLREEESSSRWFRILGAGLVVSVGLLALITTFDLASLLEDAGQQNARVVTLTGRLKIWDAIFDNGLAFSAFGYGFDASRDVIGPLVGKAYHAHNLYLNILVELGVVGFAMFLAILATWIWHLINYGTLLSFVLCAYTLLLGFNNPGMFTKLTIMLLFMLSFFMPLFFPRLPRPATLQPARTQSVAW